MINKITFPPHEISFRLMIGVEINQHFLENLGLNGYVKFNFDQRKQIRLGILHGLDISGYAHKEIPAKKMEQIRLKLLNKMGK
jgi:hypothetical protein